MKRRFSMITGLLLILGAGLSVAEDMDIVITTATKKITETGRLAIREIATVSMTNLNGAAAGDLSLAIMTETNLMAFADAFSNLNGRASGQINMNTVELTNFFAHARVGRTSRKFDLIIWDYVNKSLLANDTIEVLYNPYIEGMQAPTNVYWTWQVTSNMIDWATMPPGLQAGTAGITNWIATNTIESAANAYTDAEVTAATNTLWVNTTNLVIGATNDAVLRSQTDWIALTNDQVFYNVWTSRWVQAVTDAANWTNWYAINSSSWTALTNDQAWYNTRTSAWEQAVIDATYSTNWFDTNAIESAAATYTDTEVTGATNTTWQNTTGLVFQASNHLAAVDTLLYTSNTALHVAFDTLDLTVGGTNITDDLVTRVLTNDTRAIDWTAADILVCPATASNNPVTLQQLNNKVSAFDTFFFSQSITSSIAGWYQMSTAASESNQTSTTYASPTQNQYLAHFAAPSNAPGITDMQAGTYTVHVHMEKSSAKDAQVKAELYVLAQDGTEKFEIDDTASSPLTQNNQAHIFQLVLVTNVDMLVTDRWGVKLKVTSIGAPAPTITVYTEGASQGFLQGETGDSSEADPLSIHKDGSVAWEATEDGGGQNSTNWATIFADTLLVGDTNVIADLGGKIGNVVEDTTPELGGNLDVNGQWISHDGSSSRGVFVSTNLGGSVGINTNSPTDTFDIYGNSFRVQTDTYAITVDAQSRQFGAFARGVGYTDLLFNGQTLGFRIAGTEKMFVTATGDVGIGTTNPVSAAGSANLDVNGATSSLIETWTAGTRIGGIASDANNFYVQSITGAKPIVFRVGVVEKARLLSDGKFGIGTNAPSALLDVNGDAEFLGPVTEGGTNYISEIGIQGLNIGTVSNMTVAAGNTNDLGALSADSLDVTGAVKSGGNTYLTNCPAGSANTMAAFFRVNWAQMENLTDATEVSVNLDALAYTNGVTVDFTTERITAKQSGLLTGDISVRFGTPTDNRGVGVRIRRVKDGGATTNTLWANGQVILSGTANASFDFPYSLVVEADEELFMTVKPDVGGNTLDFDTLSTTYWTGQITSTNAP